MAKIWLIIADGREEGYTAPVLLISLTSPSCILYHFLASPSEEARKENQDGRNRGQTYFVKHYRVCTSHTSNLNDLSQTRLIIRVKAKCI